MHMFLCNGPPDPWLAITFGGNVTRRHTRALAGLAGAALVVSLAPMGAQAKDAAPPASDTKASTAKKDDLPNPLGGRPVSSAAATAARSSSGTASGWWATSRAARTPWRGS